MIRAAQLEDAATIHGLHIASVRALARSHYGPEQIEAWCGRRSPASYREPIERKVVLVAEQGGRLAGFGQLDPATATVEAVYVHPSCVGLGIGRALLQALEEAALALGLRALRLDASLNAEGFYRRAAYVPLAATEHELSPGVTIPCVTMTRCLLPATALPMNADIRIVDFHPRQADDLVAMWRASFEHGVGIRDPHSLAEQRRYLLERVLPNHAVHLALQGTQIVGFLASSRESIAQLYVRVACIGMGIGTRLLTLAKDESAGRLWLYTFARNTPARGFYERRGFVAVAHGFEPTWQLEDVKYEWVKETTDD